jgi:signal transduction histidine kinase
VLAELGGRLTVRAPQRLNEEGAAAILREVKEAVADWEKHAKALGMARSEQDFMGNAFNL